MAREVGARQCSPLRTGPRPSRWRARCQPSPACRCRGGAAQNRPANWLGLTGLEHGAGLLVVGHYRPEPGDGGHRRRVRSPRARTPAARRLRTQPRRPARSRRLTLTPCPGNDPGARAWGSRGHHLARPPGRPRAARTDAPGIQRARRTALRSHAETFVVQRIAAALDIPTRRDGRAPASSDRALPTRLQLHRRRPPPSVRR